MKKITLLAAIVIIALQIFAEEKVQAQPCPNGYTNYSFIYTYTPTGCKFNIQFCYSCETIGTAPLYFTNLNITGISDPLHPECNGTVPNMDSVILAIYHECFVQSLCHFPPCTEGARQSILESPICAALYTTVEGICYTANCPTGSSAFCRHYFLTCVDYQHNPPVLHLTQTNVEQVGTPTCQVEKPNCPLDWHQPSVCWQAFPCNP